MPRFFVRKEQIENGIVTLLGDDAHHISRSLRMAAGERIVVCDMQKTEYSCTLVEFLPDRVLARVDAETKCDTEPPFEARLYQALPKGEKLDTLIQKSVECGVSMITTFNSERCIVKEKGDEENKLRRRNKIALEAAKQSIFSDCREAEDHPEDYEEFSRMARLFGGPSTIKEYRDGVAKVTKEQISRAAMKTQLDAVYFLRGELEEDMSDE